MNPPPASVLVVDDEVDACENLRDLLSEVGYRVDLAHDGRGALELARQAAYDVVLLDLKLPDMDGLDLYREIKRLHAGTVPIIISASASGSIVEKALGLGVRYVLRKPLSFPKLVALVKEAVEQPLVLVVDDDPIFCAGLCERLRERNFRVTLAHDEPSAVNQLQDRRFRVVLVDLKLADGNGAGVFRRLRQVKPHARAVLITGHRDETDQAVRQLLEEGDVDAVCYKPFDVASLLATIERLAQPHAP